MTDTTDTPETNALMQKYGHGDLSQESDHLYALAHSLERRLTEAQNRLEIAQKVVDAAKPVGAWVSKELNDAMGEYYAALQKEPTDG